MAYELIITSGYLKKLKKFVKKHPEVLPQYVKTIALLAINPKHPSLRLHGLHGKLNDYHSVAINMSYRIVIDFIIKDNQIMPIDIDTHNQVY
ncbi:HigB toxin protein [uncultured Candidatus Thioglobus sp.]|nr:HigB toxin protein [uncultured Candidatus Thioglobus sp.]